MKTRKEASEILGVSLPTFKKIAEDNRFNFVKVGKNIMYFENELIAFKHRATDPKPKVEPEKKEVQTPSKLPTLDELLSGHSLEVLADQEKQKQLSVLLNQEPPQAWLKNHPIAKKNGQPSKYLPIERVEYLLTRIFGRWWVEIIYPPQLIANSVQVTVRLFVVNPITLEVMHQDGVGAVPIQMDAKANAMDLINLKSNGVMLATPMAKTYAIKDASENFGKIFGKDLNRDEAINYETIIKTKSEMKSKPQEEIQKDRLLRMIEMAGKLEELENIKGIISDSHDDELMEAYEEKEQEILGYE